MAGTTIGRVEFIVDLDGDKIPAQARKIARDIAKAGKASGDDFGEEFENSFSHRLSGMGANIAAGMRKQGRLASETFMQTFERGLKARQSKIQNSLVDSLIDKDSFRSFAEGFDSVDEAVDRLILDLQDMNRTYLKSAAGGRKDIILKKQFEDAQDAARAMGAELKGVIEQEAELEKQSERLEADIARLTRTIGDTGAFRTASERIGSVSLAYQRLRDEIDGLAEANQIGLVQQERMVDALDRTRESVDDAIRSERELARQQREAADAAEEHKDKLDRLNAALADIDRKMGNLDAYRDRVKELGSVSRATADLKESFDKLKDLGASERSIVNLDNKLKSFNKTLKKDKDAPGVWARVMDKAAAKASQAWQRMDGTVKLVLVSILSAGPTVATLGSALGAGIVAVGAAVTSMAIGVAAGIAIFSNLLQDIDDAPAAMKPAIQSFLRFKEALSGVNDEIAQAAFDEMGGAFDTLGDSLKALSPSLQTVGTSLGKLIRQFAEGTKPGTEAFKEIDQAIQNAGPNLEALGGIVGRFGTALLRAFNQAQPLVEDMFNWLGKLTGRFDAWTKSDDFSQWVRDAQRVWEAFGGTLDAIGRALNDLVTPEAVDNTVKLLDNLSRLAPSLGNLLSIFGALDPIGLLVDILADIGEALAPLTPMLVVFAQTLNNIVEAVPAGVWIALAASISLVAGRLLQLKLAAFAAKALEPLVPTFQRMLASLKGLPNEITGVSKGLSTLGKAGVVGAAVVGFLALTDAAKGWAREIANIDGIVKKAVVGNQSLIKTVDELSGAAEGLSPPLTDVDGAFENLSRWQGNVFENIGAAFDEGSKGAHDLNAALKELDGGMKDLPIEDQQKKFAGWAKELGATDKQVLQMLDSMPQFKDTVTDLALAEDGTADATDMVRIALGELEPAAEGSLDAFVGLAGGLEDGATAAQLQSDALELLTGKSLAALDAVEGVSEGIRSMGSAFRSEQDAAIGYQESLQSVTDSLADNGAAWDITTEAGRENRTAMMDLAQSTLDYASEIYNMTGSQEDASAAIQAGRDAVIAAVGGMDLGGLSAEEYADKLGLIPGDVNTVISANTAAGMEMADAFATRLYELGLIEVNPVLALDAVNAQAEADKIQAELDGLTLNSYVTTLDANGDPVSGVVEATSRSLEGFVNGEYITTLDANGVPVTTKIAEAEGHMSAYAAATATAKLDADPAPAKAVVSTTAATMKSFGAQTFTPTLDVNNIPGMAKTDATKKKLDAMDASTTTPKIDANATKANDKIKSTTDTLTKLDGSVYTPKITADASDALSDTARVKSGLDAIKSKTVTITVNTNYPNGRPPNTAVGGMFFGSQVRRIAEAGPEAVVPLNRPLNQVDPSVRALSAFAQGMGSSTSLAGGGGGEGKSTGGGTSRVVNIQPGAIVVQGSLAPEATATMTVNRIAERIAG